jgi:hypothetical protein
LIVEQMGLPPEILPVVGIDTVCLVMVLAERTPFSFKIKHIKIGVLW